MIARLRNRHLFASDVILLVLAAYFSYVLRLDRLDLTRYWPSFVMLATIAMLITPMIFRWIGIYSRYWRYVALEEILLLTGATSISIAITYLLLTVIIALLPGPLPLPRSVPIILLLLAPIMMVTPRILLLLLTRYERHGQHNLEPGNVLIVGAGDAGAQIVHDLRRNWRSSITIVGFIDDNQHKYGMHIHGVPVLGGCHAIASIVQQHSVHQVIIAMPSVPGKVIREIVGICEKTGVQTKIIPSIDELLDGTVRVSQLRDVQISDLLRRAPIRTDVTAVTELIRGKRVLVTGGGGSIGSELCRQILQCEPKELVILGHGENSVFAIHNELLKYLAAKGKRAVPEIAREVHGDKLTTEAKPACRLEAIIADIRFAHRIQAVFAQYRPEIVFHAAAHKHVPLMEVNPVEAITNNVLGTRNVLNAALAVGVEHFVQISTDKAVNPTSIMGASKRVAELLVHQAAVASGKPYVAVRFGNVLGSRGSVVLTFQQQIAAGGPITITHPEMRRFFMTIPEAVQLVLQAAILGRGGEVFTLDMGDPVKIVDLARDMIKLSGLEVGQDIDIVFTGMRPGEKLYEELFVPGEAYHRTVHEKIFIAHNASTFVPSHLNAMIDAVTIAAQQSDKAAILDCLQSVIPQLHLAREVMEEYYSDGSIVYRAPSNTRARSVGA